MRLGLLPALLTLTTATVAADSSTDAARRDEYQYLTRHFTLDGFDEAPEQGKPGFDEKGSYLVPDGLPEGEKLVVDSDRYGSVEFVAPPVDGDRKNLISCEGQEIKISTKRVFNVLFSLGLAHDGMHHGWVEFTFDDGSTARGPLGYSDRTGEALLGEEEAFVLPCVQAGTVREGRPPALRRVITRSGVRVTNLGRSAARIWLQRTPIPAGRRVVSIRLPELPNAKILALTLGWREGVHPFVPLALPEPEPAVVGVFSEPGFPHYNVRGDLTPEGIRAAFQKAGIPAVLLSLGHVRDPKVLHPDRYPVLVLPYGNTFPAQAEETIRAYRKAGGCMVHLGVPFTHPVTRTPYGNWVDSGHTSALLPHEGDRAMGSGGFTNAPATELVADSIMGRWGLKDIAWDAYFLKGADMPPHAQYLPQLLAKSSLHPEDEVVPLLGLKDHEDPFAAIVLHKGCAFAGCADVWLGMLCPGLEPHPEPLQLTLEVLVRAVASILREKEPPLLSDEAWQEIEKAPPEDLHDPAGLEPVLPAPDASGHLPQTATLARKVLYASLEGLTDGEKVLLASAQGLVNRSGGEVSVFLVDNPLEERILRGYRDDGHIDELTKVEPSDLLDAVGHRNSVLADPEVYGSFNLAVAVAAAEGTLVAYPGLVERYGLKVAADLRGLFRTQAEACRWAFENIRPALEGGCLAMVEPSPGSYRLVDYLIAGKIFPFWVSWGSDQSAYGASQAAEIAEAARVLANAPVATPVLTASSNQAPSMATQLLSRFGKYRVEVSGCSNLSFTSGMRSPDGEAADEEATPRAAEPAEFDLDKEKVYVGCVATLSPSLPNLQRFGALSARVAGGPVTVARSGSSGNARTATLLPRLAANASRSNSFVFEGLPVSSAAFDLFPVETRQIIASLDDRAPLGSTGLGSVDSSLFGTAYADNSNKLLELYWKLTDRIMKEKGQEFLVLEGWDEVGGESITLAARLVESARIVLPERRAESIPAARDAVYSVEGRAVVHQLVLFPELRSEQLASSALASARPAFTWSRGSPRMEVAPEVVLVSPLELAALAERYLATAPERRVLVDPGSVWKYDDSGKDLKEAWRAVDFDDSKWSEGEAELGYGDDGAGAEKTTISFGPDESNKRPCAYFRRAFEVSEPGAFESLTVRVLRDDGCVVYLNGKEAYRSNLPEGEITFETHAVSAVGGSDETAWHSFEVKPSSLRKGRNVVAVEMHQANATSSDLSFDLELLGYRSKEAPGETEGSGPDGGTP